MDDLIKISGSSGLRNDNCVQRFWCDVHAISSHVVMNFDVAAENFGRWNSASVARRLIRCFRCAGKAAAGCAGPRYNPTSDFARMLVWISEVPPMMVKAREFR